MSEVIRLRSTATAKRKPVAARAATVRKPSAATTRKRSIALYAGVAFGAIAAAGMALSLSHQAHGVQAATSASEWEAWAMAIEIDLGFIAAKLVPYVASSERERHAVEVYAKPLAIGVLILSAFFNASGFSGYVPTGYVKAVVDVTLGCAAPGIVFALSQMAAVLLLGKRD